MGAKEDPRLGTSSLVYSTAHGRMCGQCRQAMADCRCAALALAQPQGHGQVRVSREGRSGKTVTVVRGLALGVAELQIRGKELRSHCGSGGTVKDGALEVQGDHCDRVMAWLAAQGIKAKRSGG